MALKRNLTKAEFDGLNATLQAEYKAEGEGYVLDASGFDDPVELKRAKEHEVKARKLAEDKATALETKLATITETDATRRGDVDALKASYEDKMKLQEKDFKTQLKAKDGFINSTLIDSVANALASELSGENAHLLLPHIKSRLSADLTGDVPLTRVLDKDGKPSAFNLEDLKKEIGADKRYASIVIASKASGGGAAGGAGGGGAASGEKKFKDLNDAERSDWFKRDPAGFQKASEDSRRAI